MRSALILLALCCLLASSPRPARADKPAAADAPAPADITAVQADLVVLTDGKKHYVALVPFGPREHFYYGDGQAFYAQRVFSSSSSGKESLDYAFWEPRVQRPVQASFEFRNGGYRMQCEERKTELVPLPDAESKAMVASARFFRTRWTHVAHALARDDHGTYYYVDRVREPEDSKVFRLWAGPKGKMKLLPMINVITDSEGQIFSTKSGELRLVLDKGQTVWIHAKTRTPLVRLPVEDNRALIYSDLGVYAGQRLGTPCDDL